MSFDYLELTDEGLPYSIGEKTIRDPVHGYITIGKHELPLLDSPLFQRLRRVKQLQTAYHVYPGAEHSRFQHSLGAMHLSGKFALALIRNTVGYRGKEINSTYKIPKIYNLEVDDVRELVSHLLAVRVAGLLHDIGHGPFSHAFDEEIISKSDDLRKRGIYSHEDLGFYLLKNFLIDELKKGLIKVGYFVNEETLESALLHILAPRREKKNYKTTVLGKTLRHVLREFLYPADILDFTIRDSYYSGAREFGMVDANRLMMFSVILMGEKLRIEPLIALFDNALNTLRAFLYSRFWLFNNVYFHKISRVFDFVIKKVLKYVNECVNLDSIVLDALDGDIEGFMILDDLYILHLAKTCKNKAWAWAKKVLNREIPFKEIYSGELHLTKPDVRESLAREDIKPPEKPEKIVERIKTIASEAIDVEPDSLIVDFPHLKFFPDNPYLPNRTFILLERGPASTISLKNLSVTDILFGTSIDVTVLRIFVDSEIFKKLDQKKLQKLSYELNESEIIKKFSLSLLYHWGKEEIGVTM